MSKVAWGAVETRSTSEAEKRAHAREKVAADARRGEDPFDHYAADDLHWAFDDAELTALREQAREVRAAERRKRATRDRGRALQRETERVLAEWDQQRLDAARAEARKRLGNEEGQ